MIWPFRKRKPAIVDRRFMNEDWCVGDLAECISEGFASPDCHDPKRGDVLRVTVVGEHVATDAPVLITALGFEGKPRSYRWEAKAFRKLRPVQTAADRGFSAWLRQTLRRPTDQPLTPQNTPPQNKPEKEPAA